MRTRRQYFFPLILCSLSASLGALSSNQQAAAEGHSGGIVAELSGFQSDKGQVLLSLHDKEWGYPTKPETAYRKEISVVKGKKANIVLKDIPEGSYAISVVHDVNSNGKVDSNFLGIPSEPVGASNNAKGSMGPPKWKDAKFSVHKGTVTQKIVLTGF
jgi:uncharacterized protein (DUF2141 family)